MATRTVSKTPPTADAQHGIHDTLRRDVHGPSAVIFNSGADLESVLSYAYGQLCILDEVLNALSRQDEAQTTALPYALRGILNPAMAALEVASKRAGPSSAGQGARHG